MVWVFIYHPSQVCHMNSWLRFFICPGNYLWFHSALQYTLFIAFPVPADQAFCFSWSRARTILVWASLRVGWHSFIYQTCQVGSPKITHGAVKGWGWEQQHKWCEQSLLSVGAYSMGRCRLLWYWWKPKTKALKHFAREQINLRGFCIKSSNGIDRLEKQIKVFD